MDLYDTLVCRHGRKRWFLSRPNATPPVEFPVQNMNIREWVANVRPVYCDAVPCVWADCTDFTLARMGSESGQHTAPCAAGFALKVAFLGPESRGTLSSVSYHPVRRCWMCMCLVALLGGA